MAALISCGAANPDRTVSSKALALVQPEVPVTPLEPATAEENAGAGEKTGDDKSPVEGAGPTFLARC